MSDSVPEDGDTGRRHARARRRNPGPRSQGSAAGARSRYDRAPEGVHGPHAGTLYLVPTPIGNLEDITIRAVRVLRSADWVAAEDTRRARILFQAHEIQRPLLSHHAHNEHRETPRLIARLLAGESGSLITDAGTPGISDPGYLLAREARAAGIPVVVLPGASAVITALIASGFPPEPFAFVGYLPPTSSRRRRMLTSLRGESRTVVLFETPHRLRRALEDASEILGDRPLAVLRELTKLYEERLTGTAAEVLEALPEAPRGEIVLVLGPENSPQRAFDGPGVRRSGRVGSRKPPQGASDDVRPAAGESNTGKGMSL